MRQEIIDYLGTLNLGSFSLSQEMPWVSSDQPLYFKNLKKIYVDRTQYSTEILIPTLNGQDVSADTTTVRLFFATDAKQVSPDYDDVITDLRTAKDANTITGVNRRDCVVSTSFEADQLITELEFRFTTITN
jgi:hypothetical protein